MNLYCIKGSKLTKTNNPKIKREIEINLYSCVLM